MIQYCCLARFFNKYTEEVKFAQMNDFSFMQLWYDNNGLALLKGDSIDTIKEHDFPAIIHAVLDINEFEKHIPRLIDILKLLKHNELIIHPVCKTELVTAKTNLKLNEKIKFALKYLSTEDIKLHLENNSKLDSIFQTFEDIKFIIDDNPSLEFLLDIAHIDNIEHLKNLVEIKLPRILHLADRNLRNIHEHLPVGQGDIDFNYIFKEIFPNYDGKIIFEIIQSDKDIVDSRNKIKGLLL